MHLLPGPNFCVVCFFLAHERLMQNKRFSDPKIIQQSSKMSVKIPVSGKNSSVVFFISSIERYFLKVKY